MPHSIDLNADLGEGFGDDLALLKVLTSASIACGAHAGSPVVMRDTVTASRAEAVRIGAHVSYPDRAGFGRATMAIDPAVLAAEIVAQIGALAAFAGRDLVYVKAHGALYNTMAADESTAAAVVEAIVTSQSSLRLDLAMLILPGCVGAEVAQSRGLQVFAEGFADRASTATGRLVPRDQHGAVLHDPSAVAAHAVAVAAGGLVDSMCVHGDTPGALNIAVAVRRALVSRGFAIAPFIAAHG